MVMFVGQENMTPVQLALETARFHLSILHGCHLSSSDTHTFLRVIDNNEAVERIDDALRSLGLMDTRAN
mgnify:CR=1 FL=1